MFRITLQRAVIRATLILLVSAIGCQPLADALTAPTGGGSTAGTVTFWTSDPSPSSIAVSVDGNQMGVLSAYRTVAPACGLASSNGALTLSLSSGTHSMSAREISDGGIWGPAGFTLQPGGCLTYALNP